MRLLFPFLASVVLVLRAESQDPLPKIFDSSAMIEKSAPVQPAPSPVILPPVSFYSASSSEIDKFIRSLRHETELSRRLELASRGFLGVPYQNGPLGEGRGARYDSDPVMQFQKVDCVTFIEQAAAAALAKDLEDSVNILQKIRYRGGRIGYESRNHFTEADWIPNNIEAGFLTDITEKIGGERVRFASKRVSKKEWYARKTVSDLQGPHTASIGDAEKRAITEEWKRLGQKYADVTVFLPYLAPAELPSFIEHIPQGAVLSFLQDKADSPTLVTHQGFFIRKDGKAYLRHAAQNDKVLDVPLQDYLKNRPWYLGVNITAFKEPS